MNHEADAAFIAAADKINQHPILQLTVTWGGVHLADESDRVISIRSSKRLFDPASVEFGMGEGYSTMEITLDNSDYRYSENAIPTSDPIQPFLGDDYGNPVVLKLGFDDAGTRRLITFFTGKTYGLRLQGTTAILTVYDRAIDYIQNRMRSEVFQGLEVHEAIEKLGVLGNVAFDPDNIDKTPFRIPVLWMDNDTVWSDLKDVAGLVNGFVFFDDHGTPKFWTIDHFLRGTHDKFSFDDSYFTALQNNKQTRDFVYKIIVDIEPRFLGGLEEIYSLDEQKDILPGKSIEFEVKIGRPTINIGELVHGQNYWVINPSGIVMDDYVDVTLEKFAQTVIVRATNNHPSLMARIEWMQLFGNSYYSGTKETLTKKVNPTTTNYRVRTVGNNVYLQTKSVGKYLLDMYTDRYTKRVNYWSIEGVNMMPHLQVGDVGTFLDRRNVYGPITGIMAGIDTTISASGDTVSFLQTYLLLDYNELYPETDYFHIGRSTLGTQLGWY